MQHETPLSTVKPVAACVAFVVCVCGALALELFFDRLRTLEEAEARLDATGYFVQEWIVGAFRGSDFLLRDLAGRVDPDDLHFPPRAGSDQAAVAALREKLRIFPSAYLAGYFDARCTIVYATQPMAGFDASQRDYCQAFHRDPALETYVSPMYRGNVGRLNVTQARVIRRADGSRAGLVAMAVDLSFFDSWLSRSRLIHSGVISILDHNQMLLARKPMVPDTLGQPAPAPELASFIASPEQRRIVQVASPVDGVSRIYALRKVGDLPFVAIVGEDREAVLARWTRKLWITLGAGSALVLLAVAALRHHLWRLRSHEQLRRLSVTDPLTGVGNRRHFLDHLQVEHARARRLERPLSLVILDIDLFKQINDTHGHLIGDDAIKAVMLACQTAIRQTDFLGRIGGEEFAVLLPETRLDEGVAAAERIRQAVARIDFRAEDGRAIPLSVSLGVTELEADDVDALQVLGRADKALYDAKHSGRNCVCCRGDGSMVTDVAGTAAARVPEDTN